jgi:hypothetical protein
MQVYVVISPVEPPPVAPTLYLPARGQPSKMIEYTLERIVQETPRPLGFTADMKWKV